MTSGRPIFPHLWLAGAISATCLAPAGAAVPAAWEKFTRKASADSWILYDWADDAYYYPRWDGTAADPHIWFTHLTDHPVEFSADRLTSGGAFVGDFLAVNVDSITVDLYIQDLDEFRRVDCGILAKGPDGVDRWYYSIPYTRVDFQSDGWQRNVRFGMEETWTHFGGTQPVAVVPDQTFLSSIKGVSITFFPREGTRRNTEAAIDNFVLEPKVTAPVLATSHTAAEFRITFTPAPGLSADLRQMTVTPPLSWSDVPGHTYITGPAAHAFTTPLDAPKKIFRVDVFPEYDTLD